MTMQKPSGPPQNQYPRWRIVGQREANRQDEQGRYVAGVIITFQMADGTAGSVFVPQSQYNADNVRNLINTRAAVMESVTGLSG